MADKKKRQTSRSSLREKPQKGTSTPGPLDHLKYDITSIVAFTLAVFSFIILRNAEGQPEDVQVIGLLGSYIQQGMVYIFGKGAWLVPAFLLTWSAHIGIRKQLWSSCMNGGMILSGVILLALGVYKTPPGLYPWETGVTGLAGGYIGTGLAFLITKLVGNIGAQVVMGCAFLVALLLITDQPVSVIWQAITKAMAKLKAYLEQVMFYQDTTATEPRPDYGEADPVIIESAPPVPDHQATVSIEIENDLRPVTNVEQDISPPLQLVKTKPKGEHGYIRPPLELLSDISHERLIDKKNIRESITVLEETFASFGIAVKVNQVNCGPAVTRYELTPGPGVKISRILSLTDDLQLNLAAPGIRIEAPIPGKAAIGIEVPNRKVLSVGLRNLITSAVFKKLRSPLAFALGEDISGNVVVARLNDMPHLLIAGSTGSGKSVCLNCIIMSLLYNTDPADLKMVFVDPKMVELTVYNGIPHLMTPVVTDPKKAALILRWMVREMEKRYQLFAGCGARDIVRYNQIAEEKIPYIIIVIDELADLMMVAAIEVEDAICRLSQMARAAGMHLIVATQRPSVDVVTGLIKANIPSRIAFAVSSQTDSRVILDMSGAEKLLGKGDMLFMPVGASKPYRVQGAFVSDRDIENTVEFIKQQYGLPVEEAEWQEMELAGSSEENEMGDDLFWDAVRVFIDAKKASVSLLQRRLKIGYARAARLVDIMEERGMISEQDNNKRREVLINAEQLEKLYARNKLC